MSLWVGNISKNVRNSELEDEFNKFGRCTIKPKVSVGRAFSHNFDLGQLCIY
jgi:RNA recognition motif-containing protein